MIQHLRSRTIFILFACTACFLLGASAVFADAGDIATSSSAIATSTTDTTATSSEQTFNATTTASSTAATDATPTASTTPSTAGTTTDTVGTTSPDTLLIHLDIETATTTLFDGTLAVAACPSSAGSATNTYSGYCAVAQSGLPNEWSWYGDDAFLNSIAGVGNDSAAGAYWTWFSGLTMGMVALNKHELSAAEKLLVTIGRMPLALGVATTSPAVGSTTTVRVTQFAFDADFNPVWVPAASSSVWVGGAQLFADASGTASFTATSTDPFAIFATEDEFLPTERIAITPVEAGVNATSTQENSTTTPATSTTLGSTNTGGSAAVQEFDTDTAVHFLTAHQAGDGSFGSPMITDWSAIALASAHAGGDAVQRLRTYLLSAIPASNSATDDERHAMALEALGIDPSSGTSVDYIARIVAYFDGTQIGDQTLNNDDIFALFPLMHAGYTASDEIIRKETTFILSQQDADGSWESVDLTSAAIQALAPVAELPGVGDALLRAESYLRGKQQGDGGFGGSFATSWVLQAIASRGQQASTWRSGDKTGVEYLATQEQVDGGVEPTGSDEQTRLWATAYAIPAALGTSWNMILGEFPKQTFPASSGGSSVEGEVLGAATTTEAATSTVTTATSTVFIEQTATSSEDSIAHTAASSTAIGAIVPLPHKKVPPSSPKVLHVSAPAKVPHAPASIRQLTTSSSSPQLAATVHASSGGYGTLARVFGALWHGVVGFFAHLF